MLLLALACSPSPNDSADPGTTPQPFRVAFIADTHVVAPQYECCSESEGIDNESIMKTPERLRGVVERVNAIDPPPEALFILGDLMHAPYWSSEAAWYEQEHSAFSLTQEILAELQVPVHIVWGNHDYEVDCGEPPELVTGTSDHLIGVERDLSAELFEAFFGQPLYQAVDIRGWRFILGNGMLGPTWDWSDERCATSFSSYGAEQLAFIDEQLSMGLPSFFLTHHGIFVTSRDEQADKQRPDLGTVLERHDNVELMMAGHTHRWIDAGEANAFPHIVIAATRYDTDNFWLLEFDPAEQVDTSEYGAGYRILDYDKALWSTTCADTWRYDQRVELDPDAGPEEGDCGY